MSQRDILKVAGKYLREADDIARLVTGRHLMEIGALLMTMMRGVPPVSEDDPYYILGIQRNCSDRVVKAAFRANAFEFHPDTGTHPDVDRFKKANEAYDTIMRERNAEAGKTNQGAGGRGGSEYRGAGW